ncbi:proprotein convertase P-domain-containing protein [Pseudobacteriovorax antillogorgiicola]|uniref:Proprotein convertase P-domain-containing protein n=1 Tax=Pseudobacteriovorax antillogorgiicola TaxID=1513793 RepID=A0A1Y6BQG4_9BACT|nr:proprotein convertase P-domain-containing protein [Pseudobacteriovorax antillogorgiicola]TCS55393.1 proprotein convertase P-domain-containing protein [Pseudobacteriovorax antillogorgiicola]SMF13101.1 Proprotein convertase P-domain-containing protein [Pseudobacteriovorax antillogorgiicola]
MNQSQLRSCCFLLSFFLASAVATGSTLPKQFHKRDRKTLKLSFNPTLNKPNKKKLTGQLLVEQYLKDEAKNLDIPKDLSNLRLTKVKQSLTGFHFHFQQMQDEIPVAKGGITVSINKQKDRVTQIYNNTFPTKIAKARLRSIISDEQAYDIAWQALKVHGQLIELPRIETIFVWNQNQLERQIKVTLTVTAPYGSWNVFINPFDSKVISFQDNRLTRKPKQAFNPTFYQGPITDRVREFKRIQALEKANKHLDRQILAVADIPTKVFDPDPRTTLNNPDLEDDSDTSMFDGAYFDRILRDVSFDGNKYSLKGPYVQIIDYDPPTAEPHQTETPSWNFKRGENPFNEAMTYFHIDQSQRYIQSLGFKGETGIQELSVEVDANGANGDDNSYFQPSSNRLSFGHGCVDDNEDADVILHEYGHAIQASINSDWIGGDTGAMGEGFGDYWAASYSISVNEGRDYFPNQIFTWDGHGNQNSCWNGRIMNALAARYDHQRNYGAHATIDGGFQSDELWSTPLFQSLLELVDLGIPREDVDKIVLQSHFGLGADLKMRDMALATLNAADNLFPNGPHRDVLYKHFIRHEILEVPAPDIILGSVALKEPTNGFFDPGDTLDLEFNLINQGDLEANNIEILIDSPNSNVSIQHEAIALSTLSPGSQVPITVPVKVELAAAMVCGTSFRINFNISHDGDIPVPPQAKDYMVGQPIGVNYTNSEAIEIPDNDPNGAISTITISEEGFLTTSNLKVRVQIAHTYSGDLQLTLTNPSGDQVIIQDRVGSSSDDIRGTFPDTLTLSNPWDLFYGQALQGSWTLKVEDQAQQDVGTIESWGLEDIVRYECQSNQ